MKIFFDTEFTGLHKDTTLISIGCIDEKGRTFYAEFTDYDRDQCDDWIRNNVIMNLLYAGDFNRKYVTNHEDTWNIVGDKEFVKKSLVEWLSYYKDVQLVSDVCHYDMILFIDMFGTAFDLPDYISPVCYDICQDIARKLNISEAEAFNVSREELLSQPIQGEKHNSLYDAKVIRELYYTLN